MATTLPAPSYDSFPRRLQAWSASMLQQQWSGWLPLAAVTLLALGLNSWNLSQAGWGNTYYAAAVRSMTVSWHNFFFGSFDPGGFITVDKPPVFLWVGALSARIFGYGSWSILLPSAIAGAAAVALLWLIVRRYFGVLAATIAGLVLALTPIAVAVDRLNLPEPFYILALIGAAGCVLRSLESEKRWWAWTIAAGLLVGIAFNTKMLAAWIPGPALVLAIVVGFNLTTKTAATVAVRQLLPRLAVFGIICLVTSLSWMVVVDAWPKSDRPFIGGSTDNSVQDLVLGYNGLGRVEGDDGSGGFGGGAARPGGGGNFQLPQQQNRGAPNGFPNFGGGRNNNGNGNSNNAKRGAPNFGPGGANGAGGIIAGAPSLFRMFDSANGAQIAWFLPFALIGGVVALWRWRTEPVKRAAVVAFLGWVVLFGGVFSYTQGIYHSYYTSAMAPGIAAIAGISTVGVADLIRKHWAWFTALVAMVAVTLYAQLVVTGRYTDYLDWARPYGMIVVVLGLAVLAFSLFGPFIGAAAGALSRRVPLVAGPVLALVGLLIVPAVWSGYEAAQASLNTTLPQAGPRAGAAGRSFGSEAFDSGPVSLAQWLESHRDTTTTWDLAVTSAQNASTLIAEYNLSVMAIGGFSGRDATITAAQFADLVRGGKIRYVLTTGGIGGGGGFPTFRLPNNTLPGFGSQNRGTAQNGRNGNNGQGGGFNGLLNPNLQPGISSSAAGANAVLSAATSVCTPVTDSSLPAQYRNSIYDCSGKADALAAY